MIASQALMKQAIDEAKKAMAMDEVPIGAIAVKDNQIIARAHNRRECDQNPIGHAEILLISDVSKKIKSWRLDGVELIVTCEPCVMCAGAIYQSRISRIVFGCYDPKAGAVESLYNVLTDKRLNHQVDITGGVMAKECGQLLKQFFVGKRKNTQALLRC